MKIIITQLFLILSLVTSSSFAESVLSKTDADNIFKMYKSEWNNSTKKMIHPDGSVKLRKLETGTVVASIDNKTGYGLSIQPIFIDDKSFPTTLIVSSFFPVGTVVDFEGIKKDIERDAETDLGYIYDVSAKYVKMANLDVIELNVTKKNTK